jgi:hypothetical protein
MKQVLTIFTFFLLTVLSSQISGNKGKTDMSEYPAVNYQQVMSIPSGQDPADLEDEDDVWIDQEFFPRKLFQKNLDLMSKKEKISWSFRMADNYPFL